MIAKKPIKILIANQKGGVAKTTTAVSLSSILESYGYNSVLCDLDSQGNSSNTYRAVIDGMPSMSDVLEGLVDFTDAIQVTENGSIVPSDPEVFNTASRLFYNGQDITMLDIIFNKSDLSGIDFIVMDTSPHLDVLLASSLYACDFLCIPVETDMYTVSGLARIYDNVKKASVLKKSQIITSILIVNNATNKVLYKNYIEPLRTFAHDNNIYLFNSAIRTCEKVRLAQAERQLLIKYSRGCTAHQDYEDFVDEFLEIVKGM